MTDLQRRLRARLQLVRDELNQVIARLDDSMLPWAPREGMRTIQGQLLEIATTEIQNQAMLIDGASISFREAEPAGPETESVAGLETMLERVRARTLAYLDGLDDAQLEESIAYPPEWFESLQADRVPRSEVVRSIAQHEWYHVGQLVSYLWARGDDPYDW